MSKLPEDHAARLRAAIAGGPARPVRADAEGGGRVLILPGKTADGLREALALMGARLRWNVRAGCIEWTPDSGDTWERLTDRQGAAWRADIPRAFTRIDSNGKQIALSFGRDLFADYVLAIVGQDGDCDPFLDWLDGLPAWDGTPRLDGLLAQFFKIAEAAAERAQWCGRYPFLGAVYRAGKPGAKLDESPVLIGGKGIGKSTLTRAILPPEHRAAWHSDAVSLAAKPQAQLEAISGRVLVEIGEMTGARKAEQGEWKRFLSRQVDNAVRMAYARYVEEHPRRCVFVGTADDPQCLPNDLNLRRFVPIQLAARAGRSAYPRIVEYMRKHRAQLWAEAVHRIDAGEHPRLPDALHADAEHAAEDARIKDRAIADAIESDPGLIEWAGEGRTLTEIATRLDLTGGSWHQSRNLATELRAKRWRAPSRTERIAGRVGMFWTPPA